MASVFTKIIANELPAYRIYEDDLIISILALDQINLGHTLVIPKQEVNHWFDVPAPIYKHLSERSLAIGKAIHQATGCNRVLTTAIGFEVPHYHLHLIPAMNLGDLNFSKATQRTAHEMTGIQEKIRSFLK